MKKSFHHFRTAAVSLLILGSFVTPVLAVGLGDAEDNLKDTGRPAGFGGSTDVPQLVGSLVNIFLGLLGVLCVLLIIYGGFIWMKARGDSKEVQRAQDILRNAVIGLIIIMAAYTLSSFVLSQLISATGAGQASTPAGQ